MSKNREHCWEFLSHKLVKHTEQELLEALASTSIYSSKCSIKVSFAVLSLGRKGNVGVLKSDCVTLSLARGRGY